MELMGVLRALQYVERPSRIYIMTDSQYIVDGFRNLGRNKLMKTHLDVWGLILFLAQLHIIETKKVKAHSNNRGNDIVDELAKQAAANQEGDPWMTPIEKLMAEKLFAEKRVERRFWT
jgi:ribonuclease HI